MADEGLPTSVRNFIDRYIVSVEQLEILLLLAKDAGAEHTVQSVYDVILSTKPSVESWLNRLTDFQLAEHVTGQATVYRFKPANEEIRQAISNLAEAYKAMPVRVIEGIYKKERTPGTQGTDPAQGFADAFRLRKN